MSQFNVVKLEDTHPGGFHHYMGVVLVVASGCPASHNRPFLTCVRPDTTPCRGMFSEDGSPIQIVKIMDSRVLFTMSNCGYITETQRQTLLEKGTVVGSYGMTLTILE